jgi:hypothetical protein
MASAPTRVITIEREYGSRGGEFAHDLAVHLGWRRLDADLPCAAARAAGVSPELAKRYDERLDPWYYRYGKAFWQDSGTLSGLAADQVFDSDRMLALIRQQIVDAAHQGNCVIVGRGSACALANQPGWFVNAFPDQADRAEQSLAASDKRRAAVIRKAYQQEWCARGLYHLLLNSCIGFDAMIAAVEGAAHLVPTLSSRP